MDCMQVDLKIVVTVLLWEIKRVVIERAKILLSLIFCRSDLLVATSYAWWGEKSLSQQPT